MTIAAERPVPEAPAFDAARYAHLLAEGEAAAAWTGLEPWKHLHALDRDAEFENIMRASFTTGHAEATATMTLRLLTTHETQLVRPYGLRIVYGDYGNALIGAIDQQAGTPAADALIDLLAATYQKEGTSPPHLVPPLRRHAPDRVMRACTGYDTQGQSMPKDEAKRLANLLHHVGAGLSRRDNARRDLARELLALNAREPRRGAMDAVMRNLLLDGTLFSKELYDIFGIDEPFHILKLWEAGYGQDLLPNKTPNPNYITKDEYMQLNAQRVLDIERQRPGGVRLLVRRFGIRNIGRVPEDWLLDLIDMNHAQYSRVILLGIASVCGNGAMMQGAERLNEVRKKLPKDMTIIPAEIARPSELQERLELLERARNISGSEATVVGAIADGHGGTDGNGNDEIRLSVIYGGRGSRGEQLTGKDIAGAIGGLLDRLLAPDAPTLIISCNMAKDTKKGFCAQLFKRLNREVIGMRETAGLSHLRVVMRSRSLGIRFVPTFRRREAASLTQWRAVTSRAKYFRPASASKASGNARRAA